MMQFFPSAEARERQLNDRIRVLRREIASIDQRHVGLNDAKRGKMKTLARLEAQLALCGEEGPVRALVSCR